MSWNRLLGAALGVALVFGIQGCSDDDNDSPMAPDPGNAQVRVAHLSPDAPPVDIWVDGAVALSNVPFRAFSDYVDLPAGAHQIQVTPTGQSTPVVIDATVTLTDGVSYTVFAQGLLSDSSIGATVLEDDRATGSQAKVRFVHASPDAPPVDITLTDGTVLFPSVPFTEAASIAVGAGAYDLQVRAAGTSTVVLSFGDVALANGTNYTVWAVGLLGDGSLDALVSLESAGPGSGTVDLTPAVASARVAHLSPDAPNVDVWVDGAVVPALTNVPFQAVSGYLELPARTTNVKVYQTGTSTTPVIDADVTLLPGEAYTIAATGLVAAIAPTVLVDDRTPPAGTRTKVRFVHASPDAPAVDVDVAAGPTLFSGVVFPEPTEYLEVDAGTYDLEVRLSMDRSLALSVPGVGLGGGTNMTIFAIGLAGDASLAALPAVDTP